jgi:methanogenic corrinoid protein MtbC1
MEGFIQRHPNWLDRLGPTARRKSEEDYAFHVEFLAGSVLVDDPEAFADYARWTAGVLERRRIGAEVLVESLEQVGEAAQEVASGSLRETVNQITRRGVAAIRGDAGGSMPPRGPGYQPLSRDARLFLQAIRSGERKAALTVAREALRVGSSIADVYRDILQPAQYQLGLLWERNEISIAHEHLATAITQYVMAHLNAYLDIPIPDRGNALVTGVSGEHHQIGACMVADILEADGWNTRFLGTQIPRKDVLRAVEEHGPRLVGISATVLFNLPAVADLVEGIREGFGSDVKIVVGGRAFRTDTTFWREMGADELGRDLREAVMAARKLTTPSMN